MGDMNIAASQKDVYDKLDREAMYSSDEKELFASILVDFQDVWRNLHPDTKEAFTVWDEKTSARAFNEVPHSICAQPCRLDTLTSNYLDLGHTCYHLKMRQVCVMTAFYRMSQSLWHAHT